MKFVTICAINQNMNIFGDKVELRPARKSDRGKIYDWLTQSDLTSSIMGPPDYPDHPVPSWDEFCKDYTLSFFNSSGDGKGRNIIISPSARNKRAIAAYRKAGFKYISTINKAEQQKEFGVNEFDDNIIMMKKITANE